METKVCTKCKAEKPFTEYQKSTIEWRARHNKFGFSLPAIHKEK